MRTYELINVDMAVLKGRHCREIKYMSDIATDEIFDFRQLEDLMKEDLKDLLNPSNANSHLDIYPVTAKNQDGKRVWMAIIIDDVGMLEKNIIQVPPRITATSEDGFTPL